MRRFGIFGILVVLAFMAPAARADVDYAYVADVTNTTLANGQVIKINLYLEEHTLTTGGQQSIFVLEGNGLFAGGLKVQRTGGDAAATFANSGTQVDGSNVALVWTGTFSGAAIAGGGVNPTQSLVSGVQSISSAANTFVVNPKSTVKDVYRDVLIAQMTITGGNVATLYTLGAKSTLNSTTTSFTNRVGLDNDNGTSPAGGVSPFGFVFAGARDVTININVASAGVPEPSSMALCGLAAAGMGLGAWRRRKAKLAAKAAEAAAAEEAAAV